MGPEQEWALGMDGLPWPLRTVFIFFPVTFFLVPVTFFEKMAVTSKKSP